VGRKAFHLQVGHATSCDAQHRTGYAKGVSTPCHRLACNCIAVCGRSGARRRWEGARRDRPVLSVITSARSMFCVFSAKASFKFCQVQFHGRLCTTTCRRRQPGCRTRGLLRPCVPPLGLPGPGTRQGSRAPPQKQAQPCKVHAALLRGGRAPAQAAAASMRASRARDPVRPDAPAPAGNRPCRARWASTMLVGAAREHVHFRRKKRT